MREGTDIACDESGAEGENLTGAAHRVFALGSTDLKPSEAAEVMAELRARSSSKADEFKAEQLLNADEDVHTWLFGAGGVLAGRVATCLIDKEYFVVGKVIDLLVEEVAHGDGLDLYHDRQARRYAWTLHREGARALGAKWPELLDAFNSLMRRRQRKGDKVDVDHFFAIVDDLRLTSRRANVTDVLAQIWRARPHAEEFQRRLVEEPDELPALDPLVAAISQTAREWHERLHGPIRIIHDEQAMLTDARVRSLIMGLRHPSPEFARYSRSVAIEGIDQVDSRLDARVQVADLVAGVSRRVATDALEGRVTSLAALLRPTVFGTSLWSDDPSWLVITGRRVGDPIA